MKWLVGLLAASTLIAQIPSNVGVSTGGVVNTVTASSPWLCKPTSASGTAYVCTPTLIDGTAIPAAQLAAPADGQMLIFIPDVDNTGSLTIKIDGTNARNTRYLGGTGGTTFNASDLGNSQPYLFIFSVSQGNRWLMSAQRPLNGNGIAVTGLLNNRIYALTGLSFTGIPVTISGCSADTPLGSATSGTFISRTSGACTVVITMNGATGLTAPNGWACSVSNMTTANLMRQSASSSTTCTVTGVTVTGDTIVFSAKAF